MAHGALGQDVASISGVPKRCKDGGRVADSGLQLYIVLSAYRAEQNGWLYGGVHSATCICCQLRTKGHTIATLARLYAQAAMALACSHKKQRYCTGWCVVQA